MDVVVGIALIGAGLSLPLLARRFAWMRDPMNRRLYGSEETGRRVDVSIAAAIGFAVVLCGVLILLGFLASEEPGAVSTS